jgi:hypothetical protein
LEKQSRCFSAFQDEKEDIPHKRNSWVCRDFKERRILPMPSAIATSEVMAGNVSDDPRRQSLAHIEGLLGDQAANHCPVLCRAEKANTARGR